MSVRAVLGLLALAVGVTLARPARAAEPDPEPPPAALAALMGTWKSRAVLVKGDEKKSSITYTFSKDKVTINSPAGKGPREMPLTYDKAKPGMFELGAVAAGRPPVRYFFKIEKGELYLTPVRPSDKDPKPDFSGKAAPVIIFTREKK